MAKEPRTGDWIQTYTGRTFYPLDPCSEDIDIEDIAHALAMKCRFGGHSLRFYSVAEHSVLVSHAVPPEFALWGLLHDAGEAYLPDVPRPVKPFLSGFREIETRVMIAVCERFRLDTTEPNVVKRADTAILADEKNVLMAECSDVWYLPEPPLGVEIVGFPPEIARSKFLSRFEELTSTR